MKKKTNISIEFYDDYKISSVLAQIELNNLIIPTITKITPSIETVGVELFDDELKTKVHELYNNIIKPYYENNENNEKLREDSDKLFLTLKEKYEKII